MVMIGYDICARAYTHEKRCKMLQHQSDFSELTKLLLLRT